MDANRKKILMYFSGRLQTEGQTGGIKRFGELTTYLCNYHDVTLCSQDDNEVSKDISLTSHIQLKQPSHKWWNKLFPQELKIFLANIATLKRLKKDKYDYIIVFDVPPSLGLALLRINNIVLMIRKDLLACADAATGHSDYSSFLNKAFLWLSESICLLSVCKICCQCEYDLKTLKKRHPLISRIITKKSFVQINNVNPSWLQKTPKEMDYSLNNINTNSFNICFIGDFNNLRKGQDILLKTARVLSDDPNIHFYIIGGGEYLEEFRELYQGNNVTFTGRLKTPSSIMLKCDLVVVPSRTDSCPNVVLESLNLGIPVIGSRVGGIPELLIDDNALFDLNVDSLVKCIKNLKENSELLAEIEKKQQKRKNDLTFNWGERITEKILNSSFIINR